MLIKLSKYCFSLNLAFDNKLTCQTIKFYYQKPLLFSHSVSRLDIGSWTDLSKLGLDLGLKLKARAWLGLDKTVLFHLYECVMMNLARNFTYTSVLRTARVPLGDKMRDTLFKLPWLAISQKLVSFARTFVNPLSRTNGFSIDKVQEQN